MRLRISATLSVSVAVALAVVACRPFDSGPFVPPDPTSISGSSGGNLVDAGGLLNDGEAIVDGSGDDDGSGGGPGCSENALSFDGTGGYADIGDAADLDLGSTNAPIFTVEAWIKPTFDPKVVPEAHILSHHNHDMSLGWAFLIRDGTTAGEGHLEFRLYGHDTSNTANLMTVFAGSNKGPVVQPNKWSHVAAASDGAKLYVYLNGVRTDAQPLAANFYRDAYSGSIRIGRRTGGTATLSNSFSWTGLIDEIFITRSVNQDVSSYVVPTDRHTAADSAATKLLLHADDVPGVSVLADGSGLNHTATLSKPSGGSLPVLLPAPCINKR